MSFVASHVVPGTGLPTWPAPDPAQPQGPPLAAGLEVQVLEVTPQGWAHVVCSNGWTAWVDAARLRERRAAGRTAGRLLGLPVVLGGLGAAGGTTIALASFLPWFRGGGESASGWDVPLYYVVFGTGDGTGGIKVGLPLVVVGGVVAVLALARQRVNMLAVLALAAVGSWSATLSLARVLRPDPHPDLGVGVILALAGAALLGVEAHRAGHRTAQS